MYWTRWLGVSYLTKCESSLRYKAINNCVISYFTVKMMTGPEISDDPENDRINPWPEHNPIALNRIILNIQTKQAIDLEYKKDQ